MTPVRISIAAAIGSVLLLLIVLELIRGRRLKERYALLWLATGLVLLVLSLWRGGLNTIAGWLGVSGYPPAILFAAAERGIPVVHYTPRQIKRLLTGSGKASKEQVQHAIMNELGLDRILEPNDVADAVAIALCHYYTNRLRLPL